jgi:phosphinothricin acetyltransferase
LEDLEIRGPRPEDVAPLTALYNHYVEHSPATFDIEPLTLEARRAWMAHYATTGPHQLWIADRAGEVIGYTTSSVFRHKPAYATSVETTVYIGPDATGTGVGGHLYAKLFESLAREAVHRAYAGVTVPNPASEALHVRFGFEPIGCFDEAGRKFDRFWSVQWYQKRLSA